MRNAGYIVACASLLWIVMSVGNETANAGSANVERVDVLPVAVVADSETLLGADVVILTGWVEVLSQTHTDGNRQVMDLRIEQLELIGAGGFGAATVTERPDEGDAYASTGLVTGAPDAGLLPGSATFNLFVDLAVPSSPIGDLFLHNEAPLELAPADDAEISAWPPYGLTFETAGDMGCLELPDESNMPTDLGACINHLSLEVAPEAPGYSVARGSSHYHPADILSLLPETAEVGAGQPPYVNISCAELGLGDAGCGGGPDQDTIDALSFGEMAQGASLDFSVGPGAIGADGSGVDVQNRCPPAEPGLSPEPESDLFRSDLDGTNRIRFDGNGPVGACVSAFPLGLLESISARDDLNAFASRGQQTGEGEVYFSLDSASPSLASFGFGPADILRMATGSPAVFATADALGLQADDDIDGLCLLESGDGAYDTRDGVLFSLTPDSPSLGAIDAGPGDVLRPGSPPQVAQRAAELGLVAGDIDALSCGAPLLTAAGTGDANCDGATTSIDAAFVLQHVAGLLETLPCAEAADVNGDGVESTDAALILQFDAGLLSELPV